MTQRELSEQTVIRADYISRLERGKHKVTIDKLVGLANGLDVPITMLIEGA